ncbi:MAG: transglutaminase-like cysteine peptidase [Syntrophales bacterium]|jgi:predicted transglutaminase-like cysteine proteinase|nr:transglutaminase-like cysteine peptidase [Syntrophales bacterium]MCK9528048.1 transglutaminase-like cysteine peptidase [Syntrophales bacterium]MDX9922357.1 transglutaminase-like cysteine peptidase [Syntrophales bacterium]
MGRAIKRIPFWLILIIIVASVVAGARSVDDFRISRELIKQAETKYGADAATRLLEWEDMIRTADRGATDLEKLEKVNDFFNSRVRYVSDWDLWGVEDYWATPFETLSRNAGDCEDFAIAKYFTLKAIGVKEEKINIMYVKALQYGIAHMVLAYYSSPEADPLILDNIIDGMLPGSQRADLLPVFGFNGSGLWTAKQRAEGKLPGKAERIKPWQNLQERMSSGRL